VKVAVNFAQILKIFAQIMANFSVLGIRPRRLCGTPWGEKSFLRGAQLF